VAAYRIYHGPRYLGQRDKFRCGPIALLNLHKWKGKKVTGRDLKHYTWMLGCSRRHGTAEENFSRTLGWRPDTVRNRQRIPYRVFRDEINKGKAAVILTKFPEGGDHAGSWHYYLVIGIGHKIGDTRNGYIAVNYLTSHRTFTLLAWHHMKWLLKHSVVWFCARKAK
jgi:hypothetical protein